MNDAPNATPTPAPALAHGEAEQGKARVMPIFRFQATRSPGRRRSRATLGALRAWVACVILAVQTAVGLSSLFAVEGQERAPDPPETEQGLVYQRRVQLPQGGTLPAIVVVEFFSQGEVAADGGNLAVRDNRNDPVPWRVLQVGPGDFCRIAFQTASRQHAYKIYYGGKGAPPKPPAWTNSAGLLLETRHWTNFNLNRLDALREAWNASTSYGKGYVPSVFHRFNPFWPDPDPFLSMYTGTLRITRPGQYRFFTSSQDCSFLLIDGRTVVAAPGWHGPVHVARLRGEVKLSSGPHEFQYFHAAAGPDACMAAAWQPPGSNKPETIPPSAFGSEAVAEYPTIPVKSPRDFLVEIAGEAPVADSGAPMVRAQFRVVSRSSSSRPKLHWDFGDGQTSAASDPLHIYLVPGIYKVTLKAAGESDAQAVVNRVPIHRALVFADEKHPPDQLAQYLPILDKYDAAKLDWPALLQLARAFDQAGYAARAAKAGASGMKADHKPTDSESALELARMVGGLLRDQLNDPKGAVAFWESAVKVLSHESWKAEMEIASADVTLHELLQPEPAKRLLDSAAARLGQGGEPALVARLNRVLGDWNARKGDKAAARTAYARAVTALDSRKSTVEQDARRGAFSRSAEEFLRAKAYDRARDELRKWEDEFPADRLEGYLSLLQARYWIARSRYAQAVATAGDLVAVNPDSAYADRLVFLAAQCEEKLGRIERARAGYQALLTDYPGSPLVQEARKRIAALTTTPSVKTQP